MRRELSGPRSTRTMHCQHRCYPTVRIENVIRNQLLDSIISSSVALPVPVNRDRPVERASRWLDSKRITQPSLLRRRLTRKLTAYRFSRLIAHSAASANTGSSAAAHASS